MLQLKKQKERKRWSGWQMSSAWHSNKFILGIENMAATIIILNVVDTIKRCKREDLIATVKF